LSTALFLASAGCGQADAYTAQSYCDQSEARSKSCAPASTSPAPYDRTRCTKEHECAVALFANPDTYLRCLANPDCAASTTDCFSAAASQPAPVAQMDACVAKYEECKAAERGFTQSVAGRNGLCGAVSWLNAAMLQQYSACIAKPCDQIKACIAPLAKAASPACE
jgi:hypothetical protein